MTTRTLPHGVAPRQAAVEQEVEEELALLITLAATAAASSSGPAASHRASVSPSNASSAQQQDEAAVLGARADALASRVEQELYRYPTSAALQHVLRESQSLSSRLYLRSRQVPKLLDGLVQQLLSSRPVDPIGEMVRLLDARMLARGPAATTGFHLHGSRPGSREQAARSNIGCNSSGGRTTTPTTTTAAGSVFPSNSSGPALEPISIN